MTTSSPAHLVFYKKDKCRPCEVAYENLEYVLDLSPDLEQYITVLQKEEHPDLVEANSLNLYPTVLVCDEQSREISRKVGAKYLTTHWFHAALTAIHLRKPA